MTDTTKAIWAQIDAMLVEFYEHNEYSVRYGGKTDGVPNWTAEKLRKFAIDAGMPANSRMYPGELSRAEIAAQHTSWLILADSYADAGQTDEERVIRYFAADDRRVARLHYCSWYSRGSYPNWVSTLEVTRVVFMRGRLTSGVKPVVITNPTDLSSCRSTRRARRCPLDFPDTPTGILFRSFARARNLSNY